MVDTATGVRMGDNNVKLFEWLMALKAQYKSSLFTAKGTLVSVSTVPTCGGDPGHGQLPAHHTDAAVRGAHHGNQRSPRRGGQLPPVSAVRSALNVFRVGMSKKA